MRKSVQQPVDPGYYTMMFLILLGLLIMFGTFVIGPLVSLFR